MFFPLLALGAGFLLASRGKKKTETSIIQASVIGARSGLTYVGESIPQTNSLVVRHYLRPGHLTAEMSLYKDGGRWNHIRSRGDGEVLKKMVGDFNVLYPEDPDAPEPANVRNINDRPASKGKS